MQPKRLRKSLFTFFAAASFAVGASRSGRAGIFDDDFNPPTKPAATQPSGNPGAPAPQPSAPQLSPAPPRIRPTVEGPVKLVRLPMDVPSETVRAETEKQVRDIYKDEFSKKAPNDRALLGFHLLSEARGGGLDRATRYVLYRDGIEASGAANDVVRALRGVDELSWFFTVDRVSMSLNVLLSAGADSTLPQSTADFAAIAALSLTAESVEAGRYSDAAKLAAIAQTLAKRSHEPALQAWTSKWLQQTREIAEKAPEIVAYLARVKAAPDDRAACGALGAFYCFHCGFWDTGLRMLAGGADATLRSVATKDLAGADTSGGEQLALADCWMSASEKQNGTVRNAMRLRACHWYRAALPKLSGIARIKTAKRIAEIVSPQLQPGLIADVYRTEYFASHVRTRVDPYIDWSFTNVPPAPGLRPNYYSVRWSGWIKAPAAGTYTFFAHFNDGARIWIDGNQIINRWEQGDFQEKVTASLGIDPLEIRVDYYQEDGPAASRWGGWFPALRSPGLFQRRTSSTNRSNSHNCSSRRSSPTELALSISCPKPPTCTDKTSVNSSSAVSRTTSATGRELITWSRGIS